MRHLLLIEDEPGLVLTLSDRLRSEGYAVTAAADAPAGMAAASGARFDLILLDLMLPGGGGVDLCRALRAGGDQTPVLMLTARGHVDDRVIGLKAGADDYLAKPFEMAELLARVEALLRRAGEPPPPTGYRFGDIEVDLERSTVRRGGAPVELSALELRLLRHFIAHRGEALSRDALLGEVWGYHALVSTRTVDVHVAWLRQKLEPQPRHPRYILTVHGVGYKFVG